MSQVTQGKTVIATGRILWTSGDLWKGKPKIDQMTKQPRFDKNNQPMMEYGFGLSIPKHVLQSSPLWQAMHEEAYTLYPSRQIPPSFAWKYKDGDGVDHNGVPFGDREGYKGCVVFALTTTIPIQFFRFENGQNIQIPDGIKCGDYIEVQIQVKGHPAFGQGKPGLYLNPLMVRFAGYGTEIVNRPSADAVFAMNAPSLPDGASAAPLAPTAPFPAMPGTMAPPPMQAPQPHYGVLPQAHQPPPGSPVYQGAPSIAQAPVAAQPMGLPMAPQSFATPAAPQSAQPSHYPSNPPGYPPMPGMSQ